MIQVLASRNGRASDDDWKDGCPAFFPKENPPDYVSGIPVNEGSTSFGVLPEVDSPLGSSRLASEGWIGRLTQQSAPDGKPDFVGAGQALVQFNLSSGPMFVLRTAGGEALGGSDGDHYHRPGDVQAFVGYRDTGYILSPLARAGGAIRLGGGGTLFSGNGQSGIDQRERLAAVSAFRAPLFGFDRPLILTLEGRIEIIGCHAPFVNLRIDGATWHTQVAGSSARVYDLPIEVAFGGYFLPRWAAYLAVGVELRSPDSTLLYGYLVRTNVGIETQLDDHTWRLGAHAGAIAGANATGFDAGLTLSWALPSWGGNLE